MPDGHRTISSVCNRIRLEKDDELDFRLTCCILHLPNFPSPLLFKRGGGGGLKDEAQQPAPNLIRNLLLMKWPTGSRFVTGHETVFPAFCFLMISDLFFVLEIQRLFHAAVNNSIHDRLFGWGVLQDQGFVPYYNKGAIKRSLVDSWAHYNNKLEKEVVAGLTDTRSVFFSSVLVFLVTMTTFENPHFVWLYPENDDAVRGEGESIKQDEPHIIHSRTSERKTCLLFSDWAL